MPKPVQGLAFDARSGTFPESLWARMRRMFGYGRATNSLASASILAFFVYCAGAGLSYMSQLVVARSIGAHSFGIFAYLTAWVTLLGYLSALGFNISLMRFIPAYKTKGQWLLILGVMRFSQRAALITGSVVAVVCACIVLLLGGNVGDELSSAFLIGVFTIPVMSLHLISAAAVRAFGGVVRAIAPERLVRDGVLMLLVGGTAVLHLTPLDARLAAAAAGAGALATLACLQFSLSRLKPSELKRIGSERAAQDWLAPSLPLMMSVIADNLMARSGVLLLGFIGHTVQTGIFATALGLSMLTALPRMAVATRVAPLVSELHARRDVVGLQRLAERAGLMSLIGTAVVALPLILAAEWLMGFFGPEFSSGAPLVAILAIGQLMIAVGGPQQHLINMTGHERGGAAIQAACAVLALILGYLAIQLFGPLGAAVSMAASLVAWHAVMAVYIYHRLHLLPGVISAANRLYAANFVDPSDE
jgi:O-antigen/teichoic acid export membrane protein